jgi:hypothetical protein
MKNKILFLGSLCLVLALGFAFVGCNAQLVEFAAIDAPKDVTVTRLGTSNNFIVSFTGVADTGDYAIVFRHDGKSSFRNLESVRSPQNSKKFTASGDTYTSANNDDGDKWYAVVNIEKGTVGDVAKGKVGVYGRTYRQDKAPSIGWSDDVTVP